MAEILPTHFIVDGMLYGTLEAAAEDLYKRTVELDPAIDYLRWHDLSPWAKKQWRVCALEKSQESDHG